MPPKKKTSIQKKKKKGGATREETVETNEKQKSVMGSVPNPEKAAPAKKQAKKTTKGKKKAQATVVEATCEEQANDGPSLMSKPTPAAAPPATQGECNFTEQQKYLFGEFVRDTVTLGVHGIFNQFEELKIYIPKTHTSNEFNLHMDKNRYKDVTCADATRVVLRDGSYIHANFVGGDPFKNRFIATQGPLSNTVVEFWRMCVQENVGYIFMLCECIEDGKQKCQRYWSPDPKGTLAVGEYMITNGESRMDGNTEYTALSVSVNGQPVLQCQHVQWHGWPDHDVPRQVMKPLELLKVARSCTSRPSVVHCSAGIGRTGAFLAIEMCYQHLMTSTIKLNVVDVVKNLRAMRMHCVQTATQLVFVYRVMIGLAEQEDIISGKIENLKPYVQRFIKEYETTAESDAAKQAAKQSAHAATAGAPAAQPPGGQVPGGPIPGGPVQGGSVPGGPVPGGLVPGGPVPGGPSPMVGDPAFGGVPPRPASPGAMPPTPQFVAGVQTGVLGQGFVQPGQQPQLGPPPGAVPPYGVPLQTPPMGSPAPPNPGMPPLVNRVQR
ncbi:unnamed protein product [Bursaphelenchus okinawaensis]|uniref:Uncharacterized protein n=1 Tax=Bursaphelenchus okinawaensis TaxID=465554 RepID=A0A811JVJ3_9BILA|nr:unnamed protein product [Bursaphelenchus okinawaensis]CAG9085056.1 unnamed protein product [Bursaphelenchus okinawaensis]